MTRSFDDLVGESLEAFQAAESKPLRQAWLGLDLAAIQKDLVGRLSLAGIDEAPAEARFLIQHALGDTTLAAALADPALVSWQTIAELSDLAWMRLQRRPLAQVLGSQPFWTLDLEVTPDVLTPRADTEALVEAVLQRAGNTPHDLVDLGTGSGAILLALLSERPAWTGLGIDHSPAALDVARRNATANGLADRARFMVADWTSTLDAGAADIVVSNPPYIATRVLAGLEPEVRDHEPAMALDGGADGLDAYRILLADMGRVLVPGGLVALEIGYDQAKAVSALAAQSGLQDVEVCRDLAGNDRVVLAQTPAGNR
ncbi:peptide chain release factor N(5)-glutamine methyltransferase [Maricaulis sp. CAU 1757]